MLTHNDNIAELSIDQQHPVSASLVGFVRYARENRFKVGVKEALDCQRIAEKVGVSHKANLKIAFKGLMCVNADDWERYDRMFDLYWQHDSGSGSSRVTTGGSGQRDKKPSLSENTGTQSQRGGGQFDVADTTGGSDDTVNDGRLTQEGASTAEALERTNFKHLNHAAELRQMEELADELAARIRRQLLRRLKINKKGRRIDMRRTLRESLQHGGDPLVITRRSRQQRIPKIVLMLDVSRSMSVYSYLFLRFTRGILGAFKEADAYAFHTKLQHIGETLRERNRVNLVEKMELISLGWRGGTRMDVSLQEFNRRYAQNVLNRRTVFVVVSDGYDTGEPDELVKQIKSIKRRVRRIVWVNPLLGQQNYTPTTRSIQAVLPHIDVFAPGHNLESLAALAEPLARI